MPARDILMSAAGVGGGASANYIEDVFSTYLFAGNSSTQAINNGIDLAGEGGMVWLKGRNNNDDHVSFDTARGVDGGRLYPNKTLPQDISYPDFDSFNSNGFTLGFNFDGGYVNVSGTNYVSWTFRKAPKFFDVVTYTGNGSSSKLVNHSLESVPGLIIIKKTSSAGSWSVDAGVSETVYYVGGGGGGSGYEIALNRTDGYYDNPLKSTIATTTTVDVPQVYNGDNSVCNASGATYVMYVFASNAGGFGTSGTDNVITCGSYVGNGSTTGPIINLGYEPQFIMYKQASAGGNNWFMVDNMRGLPVDGTTNYLLPNSTAAEGSGLGNILNVSATGFQLKTTAGSANSSGSVYFYMAIRRPMKVPTDGATVFYPTTYTETVAVGTAYTGGFVVDSLLTKITNDTFSGIFVDRLRGSTTADNNLLFTALTDAETDYGIPTWSFANNTGVNIGQLANNSSGRSSVIYQFRRASGFFDVVCYTGTGATGNAIAHNLTVAPELIIIKGRTGTIGTNNWQTLNSFTSTTYQKAFLNLTDANTSFAYTDNGGLAAQPTATTFTVDNVANYNNASTTYVAYLFATCAGVSKVGSYTGNGTTQTINCGFTGGARFVMIKRTDSTGDWYVWDTARGMVSGTDPKLALNSTAAETNANWVYTATTGFQIVTTDASVNASGGSYIFLAIS